MRLVASHGADVMGKLEHLADANWVGKTIPATTL
jgi:hypothetical protein